MKTILIATDFSEISAAAADFGYHLAKKMKAEIVLLHAVVIPSEVPQSDVMIWSERETDLLVQDGWDGIKKQTIAFESKDTNAGYNPSIIPVQKISLVSDVIFETCEKFKCELVVMGTHEGSTLSTFLLGDHCHQVIGSSSTPVMLVPAGSSLDNIKVIGFASECINLEDDIVSVRILLELAKVLVAAVSLVHIVKGKTVDAESDSHRQHCVQTLERGAGFSFLSSQTIANTNLEKGLEEAVRRFNLDMICISHHPRNFLERLFDESHADDLADSTQIPLLVFPKTAINKKWQRE